jgi:hypothetical protein
LLLIVLALFLMLGSLSMLHRLGWSLSSLRHLLLWLAPSVPLLTSLCLLLQLCMVLLLEGLLRLVWWWCAL